MISEQAAAAGVTTVQLWSLYGLTAAAIMIAHVHSFREALAHVRGSGRSWPSWRFVGSLVARHEFNYAKRVPMLLLFVITTVAVVTLQF